MSWNVEYVPAFLDWVGTEAPSEDRMRLVEAWIESARQIGPPRGSFQVGDLSSDLYVAPVERANVRATFVAVEQDRFMRVMSFR